MKFYYNPIDRKCKNPVGAFSCENVVTLNIYKYIGDSGEDVFSAQNCNLILYRDGHEIKYYQMKPTEFGWTVSLKFHKVGLYFYYFQIGGKYLQCGRLREGELADSLPVPWQLTAFEASFSAPEWFKGSIMYQIFPDRFYKVGEIPLPEGKIPRMWGEMPSFRPNEDGKILNNDFFGGNLNGVRAKLDYLKSLGVTVIYFNPIFEAYSNHRYDTADYMSIDPVLGTEEDFRNLVDDARGHGIQIVLDGVFNHTGSDSRYFNKNGTYPDVGAYQSKNSPYADWYTFRSFPNVYDSWWGIETLPALRESSSSYQKFMFGEDGVLKHWLRYGIGGYRLDVADELPDFFLKKLRTAVKEENPNALVLGEVWEDASNKISYGERREYFQGLELDSVMNYPLKNAIIDFLTTGKALKLRETIAMLLDNYPKTVLDSLMNILSTHDTARILTVLGGKHCDNKEEMAITFLSKQEKIEAIKKLKAAAVLQYFLPGVPCIYYGDEMGMEGYRDPFCRGCAAWDNADLELTDFYKKLGKIRGKYLNYAFRDGVYREVYASTGCLVFERKALNQTAYVFVNNSKEKFKIEFRGKYKEYISEKVFNDILYVDSYSYGVLSKLE